MYCRFRFVFLDIGQTNEYGNPVGESLVEIPFNSPIASLNSDIEAFDLFLPDGRYRVVSAMPSVEEAI